MTEGGKAMKHKRFSEEKIIGVLKEHGTGAKMDDICRRHGISSATIYTFIFIAPVPASASNSMILSAANGSMTQTRSRSARIQISRSAPLLVRSSVSPRSVQGFATLTFRDVRQWPPASQPATGCATPGTSRAVSCTKPGTLSRLLGVGATSVTRRTGRNDTRTVA
ncbi:transposase [Rhodobacteraceae bacterium 2CG4]|uniref:Transposase n=1 Tax=Halovulum marinum TaxID=2662447 RepID=A0A6L5Z0Z1_9RHOB|nr:transposase [Halovulum marinum]